MSIFIIKIYVPVEDNSVPPLAKTLRYRKNCKLSEMILYILPAEL